MKTTTHLINGFQFTIAGLISNVYVHAIVVFVIILGYNYLQWKRREINKLASKLKGPKAYPLIGICYQFIGSHQRKEYNTT